MTFVAPNYLCESTLPLASDVFYHDKIVYSLPTGFHPIELNNIASFPSLCQMQKIELPSIIWDCFKVYFDNTRIAKKCLNILEPLHKAHITSALFSYPRDSSAIEAMRSILKEHPDLMEKFLQIPIDFRFVSREVLSHVAYEVYLERGYGGTVEYFIDNSKSVEIFNEFVGGVMLNRLKSFCKSDSRLLIYDHSWYPIINSLSSILLNDPNDSIQSEKIEQFRYKLFEAILLPIYGRCDNKKKSKYVYEVAKKHADAISALKNNCEKISIDVLTMSTDEVTLQQKQLIQGINYYLTEPITELIEKPKQEVKNLFNDVIFSSSVVAGLFSINNPANYGSIGLAIAAGTVSSGVKALFNQMGLSKKPVPTMLIKGMQKARIREDHYLAYLSKISIQDVHPMRKI